MDNIAIIGASGAIGKAFVDHYKSKPKTIVHAFSRQVISSDDNNVHTYSVDFFSDSQIFDCIKINLKFDKVIIATGILQDDKVSPEKKYQDLEPLQLHHYFEVNTIMPILVAKKFIPYLDKKAPSIMAFLSARVGSISDNRLGGWYGYRASKSALNMLIKTLSIELKRSHPDCILVGMHPGTVDSNLSKPFQNNIPKEQLFTPVQSVGYLSSVMNSLTQLDSGKIIDWAGKEIKN
jgi:NAD(P)-dependent dehydrogenase (short-subunit alcohol dehydrogenase family)